MNELSLPEHFIINGLMLFIPTRRQLCSADNSQLFTLHTPASECLKLLLLHQGEIISREELIQVAWGSKSAQYISNNTFYQTISHLRKILAEAGYSDLITTIPRKGLMVESFVPVEYVPVSVPSDPSVAQVMARPRCVTLNRILIVLFVSLMCLSGCIEYFSFTQDVFYDYASFRNNQCHIFYSPGLSREAAGMILKPFAVNCNKPHSLYVTGNKNTVRRSVIFCDETNKNKRACHTALTISFGAAR